MTSSEGSPPSSKSPDLALVEQTPEERERIWRLNGESWSGPLSPDQYVGREKHLSRQLLTKNGGVNYWILTDTTKLPNERPIFSSCESYKKRALVKRPDRDVMDSISYSIGSVFCDPKYRGRGYARRMMGELGKKLDHWNQLGGQETSFTVLYSDIGKIFYTKTGWEPFESSHITLPPNQEFNLNPMTDFELLYASDLELLCQTDERKLRKAMSTREPESDTVVVALIPDLATISWLHAREEYVGLETRGRAPKVKGALVHSDGGRFWCIWSHFFSKTAEEGNVLSILRIVAEDEGGEVLAVTDGNSAAMPATNTDPANVSGLKKLLQAAQSEAAKLAMNEVQIWNPSHCVLAAATIINPHIHVIQRDQDSIASLRWHGSKSKPDTISWIANEKYSWC
ncbi:uncharacterized protein KY384_007689 [Bacidia gigantensis]|uniref:uncharacterized protein n=1 Tax=Bacidia gigantensis TaxID=2732470 RepID=UPI001D040025|nr:uncharacterized protein KY384_007689 [Bacidia gigantensis]KAG8527537.1 hypothetical protein KY384_007689 [Bacidia gigantensis]